MFEKRTSNYIRFIYSNIVIEGVYLKFIDTDLVSHRTSSFDQFISHCNSWGIVSNADIIKREGEHVKGERVC